MLFKPLTLQHLPGSHHHLSVAQPTLILPQHHLHRVAERPISLPAALARAHVRRGLVRLAPAQQDPLVGSQHLQQLTRRSLKAQTGARPEEF